MESVWYKIGDKNIIFNLKFAIIRGVTNDNEPFSILDGFGSNFVIGSDIESSVPYASEAPYLRIKLFESNELKELYLGISARMDTEELLNSQNIEVIDSSGTSILEGQLSNIPDGVQIMNIIGQNALSGDIEDLPSDLTFISVRASQSHIAGDIKDLPDGVLTISIVSLDIITGVTQDLHPTITFLNLQNASLSGAISYLPRGLTSLSLTASSSVTGPAIDLPRDLGLIQMTNRSGLSGYVSDLPAGARIVQVVNQSTIEGAPEDFPTGVTGINMSNATNIVGDIKDFPAVLESLVLSGVGNIYGDLYYAPIGLRYLSLPNGCTISTYTSGRIWTQNMDTFRIVTVSGGLSTTDVDNLLIDLSLTSWSGGRLIQITGTNAPRSSNSDAAVNVLQLKGVTVTTNI